MTGRRRIRREPLQAGRRSGREPASYLDDVGAAQKVPPGALVGFCRRNSTRIRAVTERLASRTLRNSVLVVGARALAKLAVFIVVVLLWRHLGADHYGRFATMIVYITLVGVIADLGLQTVFIRDASKDRTVLTRYLATLLSPRLLLSLVALVILAAALRLLSPALFPYTLAAFVLLLTTSYSSLLRAVFYIRGRLGYEAVAIVAESLLLLGLTLVAIQRRARWEALLLGSSASYPFTCPFAFEKSYKMLAILGLPLAVGIGVTADSIVHFTRGFEESIPALRILAPSVVLLFVNNAFIYTLTAINRQLDFTRLALFSLVVNVALNLVLIPPYGYLGAAAASTITEVALFAGGWWLLRRHLASLSIVGSIAPVVASGLVMGIVVYLISSWPLAIVIILGAAVYLAALLVTRALNPEEWSIVRSGFRAR